jgi:hypothetical protein
MPTSTCSSHQGKTTTRPPSSSPLACAWRRRSRPEETSLTGGGGPPGGEPSASFTLRAALRLLPGVCSWVPFACVAIASAALQSLCCFFFFFFFAPLHLFVLQKQILSTRISLISPFHFTYCRLPTDRLGKFSSSRRSVVSRSFRSRVQMQRFFFPSRTVQLATAILVCACTRRTSVGRSRNSARWNVWTTLLHSTRKRSGWHIAFSLVVRMSVSTWRS